MSLELIECKSKILYLEAKRKGDVEKEQEKNSNLVEAEI